MELPAIDPLVTKRTRNIVRSIVVLVLPNAFDAVIVWVVCNCDVVGEPEIAHVVLSSVKPGNGGLAVHDVTVLVNVGVTAVIALLFTKANGLPV